MFLNGWPNRTYGDVPPAETTTYFDFAVAERPVYKRGSGPPLQLPTPQADHSDKDGIIIDFFPEGEPRFVVGSISRPGLRVTVKMIDILDWVSAKTYEDWETERSLEAKRKRKLVSMHWKARKKMEEDALLKSRGHGGRHEDANGSSRIAVESEDVRMPLDADSLVQPSSGRRRRVSSLDGAGIASQPSLTLTPSKQQQYRGLAEIISDSSEEVEDVEMADIQLALEMQMNGAAEATSRSTPDPLTTTDENMQTSSPAKKATPQKRISSFFLPGQKLSSKTKKTTPRKKSATPPPPIEEEDEEPEWEVERILDDRMVEEDDGTRYVQYLIRWVGEYDDTWEPEDNVSRPLIKLYKRAKKARDRKAQQLTGDDGTSAKLKRLAEKEKKRKREAEEGEMRRKRASRSASRALENGGPVKQPSRDPQENGESRRSARSKSREVPSTSGAFINERRAPVANMFGVQPVAQMNGPSNGATNGKGLESTPEHEVVRESLPVKAQISAPLPRAQQAGIVIDISSGVEESDEDEEMDDELA